MKDSKPDPVMTWATAHIGLVVISGVILVVLLGLLLAPRIRRSKASNVLRMVTTPLVLAWEAQGLHHLAVKTGVKGPVAPWILALVTSAVLITLATAADEHHQKHGTLGWPGRLVWVVAIPMGLTVSLTATSVAEVGLRIILPLLVALVWWVKYAPPIPPKTPAADADAPEKRKQGSWRLTPRRIGVALGLLDPTDADLNEVHVERQIRKLTTVAHRIHHGSPLLKRARKGKLRRLGLLATEDMVAEVQRRVALVHDIQARTAPDASERQASERQGERQASERQGERQASERQGERQASERQGERQASERQTIPDGLIKTPSASRVDADEARALFLAREAQGAPTTGRVLGEAFGRSESWGRTIIAGIRKQRQAGPGENPVPVEPDQTSEGDEA